MSEHHQAIKDIPDYCLQMLKFGCSKACHTYPFQFIFMSIPDRKAQSVMRELKGSVQAQPAPSEECVLKADCSPWLCRHSCSAELSEMPLAFPQTSCSAIPCCPCVATGNAPLLPLAVWLWKDVAVVELGTEERLQIVLRPLT